MGLTSTSAVMLCPPQKSSISCVSGMPPMGEAGEAPASEDKTKRRDGERLLRRTDQGEVTVAAEKLDVGIDVVIGSDRVEHEVEAARVFLHFAGIAGDHDLVGAQAERVFLLVGRGREDDDMGTERMSELHAHVAQSTQTNHADFLTFGDAPVAHRRSEEHTSELQSPCNLVCRL